MKKTILFGLLTLLVLFAVRAVRSDEFKAAFSEGFDAAQSVTGGAKTAGETKAERGEATAASAAPDWSDEAAAATPWTDEDWTIFSRTVRWALDERLDTLPLGETVAQVGRSFVGTPYVPHTLEADGPEHLVIDFRELDCVTFVETALATAGFVRLPDVRSLIEDRPAAERRYGALLSRWRYRAGRLDGYPSRLHYFTDWIADAEAKGLAKDLTRSLGGARDDEPITFMTMHVSAYRQLAEDTANVSAMGDVEARLGAAGHWMIPEVRIAEAATGIRDGDVIAATSTVPGLDVAHTGIALWVGGTLRLMHAPLVGDSVQISEETLAQRVQRISGQDGILVARPVESGR